MFMTSISIFSEFILIVFSLLLWMKDSPIKKANRLLAITFSLLAVLNLLMLFLYYVHIHQMYFLLSWFVPLDQVLIMFIGPFLYFYMLLLFDGSRPVTIRQLFLHALPALPALVYAVYFITLPLPVRIGILMNDSDPMSWMDNLLDHLFYIQSLAYLLSCFLKVNKQRESNYLIKVNGYQTNIRWLHQMLALALLGHCIEMTLCIIQQDNDARICSGIVVISLLGTYMLIQSLYFTGLSMHHSVKIPRETTHTLKLKVEQIEDYLQRLCKALETDKLYLDHHCSQESVSAQTGIPKHHLSQLVNSIFKKNFSDYINEYRCRYARTLLENADNQRLTIDAIGALSGFSNRVNFNHAFKKVYGVSPSNYQANKN